MKFGFGGVHLSTTVRHVEEVVTAIKLGEELGYDYAWLSDRTRDTYVNVTAAALATSRIKIGPGVTNPFTRHPAVTARAIATIDELSGGRAILGVGAGNMVEMTRDLGYDVTKGARRVEEMVQIIRQLLEGRTVDFDGEFFKVKGLKLGFKTRPDVQIYVSAQGPKMLETAGAVGDAVIIPYTSPEILKAVFASIRQGCDRAGKKFEDLQLKAWLPVYITEHRADIYETLRAYAALMVLLSPISFLEKIGITREAYDVIKKGYVKGSHVDAKLEEEYGRRAREYITNEIVNTYVLAGNTQEVIDQVEKLRKLGFAEFGLWVPSPIPAEKRKILTEFAEKIIPHFR